MFGIYKAAHKVASIFNSVFGPLLDQIKSDEGRERARHALISVIDLGEHALPFAREVALLAPGAAISVPILEAASKIGVKVEDILKEPDYHKWVGLSLDLVGQSTRGSIAAALPKLEHGLDIAGNVVRTAAELDALPNHLFHGAAQAAYITLAQAGEIERQVRAAVTPPAVIP